MFLLLDVSFVSGCCFYVFAGDSIRTSKVRRTCIQKEQMADSSSWNRIVPHTGYLATDPFNENISSGRFIAMLVRRR